MNAIVRGPAVTAALLGILAAGAVTWPTQAAPHEPLDRRVPVLVELFTSEGCSSCPAADQVLARLLEQQPVAGVEIVGLSEHVDYWNRLGWSDPYSDARFSARQEEYARAWGGSGLYTPQAVVDGRTGFVGSDRARAVEAAARAGRMPKARIEISRTGRTAAGVTLVIRVTGLAAAGRDGSADVVLAVTEDHLASNVSRGENQGRRLTHAAVVRRMTTVGRVAGAGPFEARPVVPIEAGWKPGDLRAVVFAQDPKTRGILGVASIALQ